MLPFSRVARLSWHHQASCRRGLIITERTSIQLFDAGAASTNTSKNNLLEDKIITDVASSDQHQTRTAALSKTPINDSLMRQKKVRKYLNQDFEKKKFTSLEISTGYIFQKFPIFA